MEEKKPLQFTKKQLETIRYSNNHQPRILISHGSKRSGKTFQDIFIWFEIVASHYDKGLKFIMVGNTLGTLKRNIISEMEKQFDFRARFNDRNEFMFLGNTIACFGGGKADSYATIQGFDAQGAFINEGTLIHENTFRECLARCSNDGARIIVESNTENPNHYLKRDFINNAGQKLKTGRIDIAEFNYQIYDNMRSSGGFIADETVESFVKNLPEGMWRDRDAFGKWVAAEGVIFEQFNQNKHLIDYFQECSEYYIGIDYGTANPCAFILLGKYLNKFYILDEYYHDGRKSRAKTDGQYSEDLRDFIEKTRFLRKQKRIDKIIIDPSAKSFITQLRHDKFGNIRKANNKVLEGIKNVANRFQNDQLYINKKCVHTIDELGKYSWDTKKTEDKPLKEHDHALDAIRYIFNTAYPLRNTGSATLKRN